MQLRGPLVGPDRWWYHTLLKETVRDTLASYGSVPESGPYLFFDQRSSNLPETHSVVSRNFAMFPDHSIYGTKKKNPYAGG